MSLQVGDNAPDFKLASTTSSEPLSLSSFQGDKHVVVLFFPLAFTSVCTAEMCGIRDNYQRYADLDAQVVGISVDSPFAQKAWAKQEEFSFPLLSDFNRTVSKEWGAQYDELLGLQGVSKRAAFVVDKHGVVRYAEVLEKASELPDFEAIQATLENL